MSFEDPLLATLRPQVLVAEKAVLDRKWRARHPPLPYGRIYWVTAGAGWIEHHGRVFSLERKRLYLIPAQTALAYQTPDMVEIAWLHYSARLQGGIDLFQYLSCDYELAPDSPRRVDRTLAGIRTAFRAEGPEGGILAAGLLMELLAFFVETAEPEARMRQQERFDRFGPVLAYIEARLQSRIRVKELAAVAHLEPSYFTRVFTRAFGMSPSRYVLHRKIEEAQALLRRGDVSVAGIAARFAFTDPFHFSHTFKRLTGRSPSAFRAYVRSVRS